MSLVRYKTDQALTPWSALRNLDKELDRVFGRSLAGGQRDWVPSVDVEETYDAYELQAELPGMKREDIKLEVVDDVVTIKGERKQESESDGKGYHRVERRYGLFERSFRIPDGFEHDKVKADYQDGVLHVSLPKCETAKPKRIEVKVK